MENYPHLEREANNQVKEYQKSPVKFNWTKCIPRHLIIELSEKYKGKIFKAAWKKGLKIYGGALNYIIANFSTGNL
jgi:hypothetical protein